MSDLIKGRLTACTEGIINAIDRTAENLSEAEQKTPEKRVFLCNSVLLMVVSITEEGIREALKEYLSIIEELVKKPYDNRAELIHSNIDKAGLVLKKHNKSKDLAGAKQVISAIHHFLQDQENYALLKTEITSNEANLKSEEISNLFKQVGINNVWGLLSEKGSLKELLGATESNSKTHAIQKWNEFYFERDAIIHRLSQASGWAPSKIAQHCEYIKTVMTAISEILSDDLSELVRQKQMIAEKAKSKEQQQHSPTQIGINLLEVSPG